MCIRDRDRDGHAVDLRLHHVIRLEVRDLAPDLRLEQLQLCLLYTSDAADERSSVDLGGRRIIKTKTPTVSSLSL